MIKKMLTTTILMFLLAMPVLATTSDLAVLPKEGIVKLTDDELVDVYTDVLVELEAIASFHATSGYTPKQYAEYKSLLKYRILLSREIHSRNIDIPAER